MDVVEKQKVINKAIQQRLEKFNKEAEKDLKKSKKLKKEENEESSMD